jgi:outer membrane protein assembly factor BamD (BamD/ComL family)
MKSLGALSLCILLVGCGSPSPEDLSKHAEEAIQRGDFPAAINAYTTIVNEHTESEYREEAMFGIAAIYHNETQDYQAAVDAYQRYLQLFPNGKRAPVALFLAAYIYNNELHTIERAEALYTKFLADYPENEMAVSAKFELDNLGLSAEQILQRREIAGNTTPQSSRGTPSTKK